MEVLKEMIYVISRHQTQPLELLDFSGRVSPEVKKLYTMLTEGEAEDEKTLLQQLFSRKSSKAAFLRVKEELKELLTNTVFFIDGSQAGYTDRKRAYVQCCREYAAACILLGKHARLASIDICKRILKHAEDFGFTELCLNVCALLKLHYATREGDAKKFAFYRDKFDAYWQVMERENLAEQYYRELLAMSQHGKGSKSELIALGKSYLQALQPYQNTQAVDRLQFYVAMIGYVVVAQEGDYPAMIAQARAIVDKFGEVEPELTTHVLHFVCEQVRILIRMKAYEECKQLIDFQLSMSSDGSELWFTRHEYAFRLAVHSGRYHEAAEVLGLALQHKRFAVLPEETREHWLLYQAYLGLLEEVGMLAPGACPVVFRVGSFLQIEPAFDKEKREYNVATLILQVCFLLLQHKYNQAEGRLQMLKKYDSRQVYAETEMRAQVFLKMVLTLSPAHFHRQAVVRRTQKWQQELANPPQRKDAPVLLTELLPYHTFWALILSLLDNKVHFSRGGATGEQMDIKSKYV